MSTRFSGGGVVAELFRDLQNPLRFSGGGVVAEIFLRFSGGGWQKFFVISKTLCASVGGGGVVAEICRDLEKPMRFSEGGVVAHSFSFPLVGPFFIFLLFRRAPPLNRPLQILPISISDVLFTTGVRGRVRMPIIYLF